MLKLMAQIMLWIKYLRAGDLVDPALVVTCYFEEKHQMVNMRALIDDQQYFNDAASYYRMFSYDQHSTDSVMDNILIEPSKITRISTRSISGLLGALLRYGQQEERNFLIVTHGNPEGLPIRIRVDNAAQMNYDFMDALSNALSEDPATRQNGRQFAMTYGASNVRVFRNEQQLNELLGLVRSIRQLHLEHLELRGCNIGAGPALRSLHELLGVKLTGGPRVTCMWECFSTANIHPISADQFARQLARLPPKRRTFTRVECWRGSSPDDDIVVAIGLAGKKWALIARDTDMIKGWTQMYLQWSPLGGPVPWSAILGGPKPPRGGYQLGGDLPLIGFITPKGLDPFVFPGDIDYTNHIAYEHD